MKSLMIMIIAFFAVSAAYAQSPEQTPQRDSTMQQHQDFKDMTKIKTSELPETVQTAILSPEYNGWQIRDAYRSNDNSGYYVTLRKGTEEKTVSFDAEGNPTEGQEGQASPEGQRPE